MPPDTAITFAALWDPDDGLVTFEGAALLSCKASTVADNATSATPKDAGDGRSQVLTVDFLNGAADGTSLFVPPSHLGFSQASTPGYLPSPAARSSVGTGAFLDSYLRAQASREALPLVPPARVSSSYDTPPSTPKKERLRIDSLLKSTKPAPMLRVLRSKLCPARSSLESNAPSAVYRSSEDTSSAVETLRGYPYVAQPYPFFKPSSSPPRTTNININMAESARNEKRVSAQATLGHRSAQTVVDSGFEEVRSSIISKKIGDAATSARVALEGCMEELNGMCGESLDLDLDPTGDPRELVRLLSSLLSPTSNCSYRNQASRGQRRRRRDTLTSLKRCSTTYPSFLPSLSSLPHPQTAHPTSAIYPLFVSSRAIRRMGGSLFILTMLRLSLSYVHSCQGSCTRRIRRRTCRAQAPPPTVQFRGWSTRTLAKSWTRRHVRCAQGAVNIFATASPVRCTRMVGMPGMFIILSLRLYLPRPCKR